MMEVENLVKIYRIGGAEIHALNGLTFEVKPGEMVAIMGPSGSGKSTLLYLLGCLDKPTSGFYKLDGRQVEKLSDKELTQIRNRKIGFVFQTFNLLPRASAVANVELPLIYSGTSKRRQYALRALERVGLKERAHHRPAKLSGGEQQRVAIARAIINNPSVILADEPTGNLDSKAGRQIMDIFRELNEKEGITVIVVTHNEDVAHKTHRILRLRDGELVGEKRL